MRVQVETSRKDGLLYYLLVTGGVLFLVFLALLTYWMLRVTFFPMMGWD